MGEVGRHVLGSQGRRLAPLPTGEVGRGAKDHAGATGHIRTAGLAEVDPVLFHCGNLPENGTERKLGSSGASYSGNPASHVSASFLSRNGRYRGGLLQIAR